MSTSIPSAPAEGSVSGPAAAATALDDALRRLAAAESLLLDLETPVEETDLHTLGGILERVHRRVEVAQSAYAARARMADEEARRSRATTATGISEASGCSRPEAFGHLNAAEALFSVPGDALRDLSLSRAQAAGIMEAMAKFDDVLDPALIESTAREVIASAGRASRTKVGNDLERALGRHLPSVDEESRDRHRHQSRSARLSRPGADGMSRFSMYLKPQHRAHFEAAASVASARAAKAAEEAEKRGEDVERPTFDQSFYDHLADAFMRGMAHFPTPQPGAPDAGADAASNSTSDTSAAASAADLTERMPGSAAAETGRDTPHASGHPVASVVVRMSPSDLTNGSRPVLTNTGALLTVGEALEMAGTGPHFLAAFFGGREHVFRVEEIDPDHGASQARFATSLQRLVLFAAHDGCCFPGCEEPASRCQVHHVDEWDSGGTTHLANLALVCRTHHNRIHGGEGGFTLEFDDGPPGEPPQPRWVPNSFGRSNDPPPF